MRRRRDKGEGPVLGGITGEARQRVLEALPAGSERDERAMWIEITGSRGGAYEFEMSLRSRREARPDDAVERHGALTVVIPVGSVPALRGAEVAWEEGPPPGLALRNPNRPPPPAPVELPIAQVPAPASPEIGGMDAGELRGSVAERTAAVLERVVNPAIASHGGRAELAAIDGKVAYLRLGGGCQGCGMAGVTLTEGIEQAILRAVPELERVLDVTDHAAGENPYYASSQAR